MAVILIIDIIKTKTVIKPELVFLVEKLLVVFVISS
jgi:hypothetical protein